MFARKFLTALLLVSTLLSSALAASPANAQNNATGTCTSTDYLGPVVAINNALGSLDYTNPGTVGSALVGLISLRQQYEDRTPPAGCEAIRPTLIALLALREDVIYAQLSVKTDAANSSDYNDVVAAGAKRFQTVGKTLNDVVSPLTFPDKVPTALAPVATAAAHPPQPCTDAAFIAQADASGPAIQGSDYAPLIKFRYKFEDMQAPSGCGDLVTLVIAYLTTFEDQAALAVIAQVDSANAATYKKFTANAVVPRFAQIEALLTVAAPAPSTPAATASS